MKKNILLIILSLTVAPLAAHPQLPPHFHARPPIPERDHPQDVFHQPKRLPPTQSRQHPPRELHPWYWAQPHPHKPEQTLPEKALMAVINGASYAIINGYFYREEQQRYVYQAQSPLNENKITIVEGAQSHRRERTITLTKKPEIGSIVQQLPKDAIAVSIANAHYWVKDSSWYIKRAEDGRFAVVQSPLE